MDFIVNPYLLVGRNVEHLFVESDGTERWYTGTVLNMDAEKCYQISYEEEDHEEYTVSTSWKIFDKETNHFKLIILSNFNVLLLYNYFIIIYCIFFTLIKVFFNTMRLLCTALFKFLL